METPLPQTFHKRPLIIGSVALAVLASLITAAVILLGSSEPVPRVGSIPRLQIPAAHAADGFQLEAEKQDATGAAVDTTFKITSKMDVRAEDVERVVRVTPAQSVTVAAIGAREFRVTPSAPLAPGAVYRIELATASVGDDGSERNRDFSWAVQTADVFRILQSVPGNGSNAVPIDTGIEVTLSQTGWEDPTPHFKITPHVEGRFETHGRSLAFVPSKPLERGRIYTVTYAQGWKLAGTDKKLEQDAVIRFETEPAEAARGGQRAVRLEPSGALFENAPDQETLIPVYSWSYDPTQGPIGLTGYSLTPDQAAALMLELNDLPYWAHATRERGDFFQKYAVTKHFDATTTVETFGPWDQRMIRLPKRPAGITLVRILPQPQNGATPEPTWFMLQLTRTATYALADEETTLLWAMNTDSRRPLTGLTASLDGQSQVTDGQGLVRFPTPSVLTSSSTFTGTAIFRVGSGQDTAIIPITKTTYGWDGFGRGTFQNTKTVSYIFADRPLYRTTDEASFFGIAQDRASQREADNLTVELRRPGILDFWTYRLNVYSRQSVQPDAFGFFQGTVNWNALTPGSYQLVVKRGDVDVAVRSIEVRDIVKPAFAIDVLPSKPAIFAGELLEGRVRVTLFDGTPLRGEAIRITMGGRQNDGTADVTTDDDGYAAYRFQTTQQPCNINDQYAYCPRSATGEITARPVQAEEADIWGSAGIPIWAARVGTDVEIKTNGNQATLSFLVRRVDLSEHGQPDGDMFGGPVSGARVNGRVIERRWEQIIVPGQTTYDPIEKKVIQRVRYEVRERDISPIALTAGADGRASLTIPLQDNVSYRYVASTPDETGALDITTGSFAKGWYDNFSGSETVSYSLEATTRREKGSSYSLDEDVSVTIHERAVPIAKRDTASILFVEAARGIKEAVVTDQPTRTFRYRADYIPNMTVRSVLFGPGGFTELSYHPSFDEETRELTVDIAPEKPSYAPGETVRATILARTKDGRPATGARIAVSAIDASLLAAHGGDFSEYPLGTLYGWVADGIIATRSSHASFGDASLRAGGAEMGGGGGETIRRNFKDTAAFNVVTADTNGEATFTFKAPDNITSWKIVAVALTPDLFAGTGKTSVPVTKPVFTDAVIPFSLLTRDAPVFKIRTFGAALAARDALRVSLDAAALGFAKQFDGVAGSPLYIAANDPPAVLPEGEHPLVIRVQTSKGSDAIERRVRIRESRFTKDDLVRTELVPSAALPDIGNRSEIDLHIMSKAQSQYLHETEQLAHPWSARAEARVAGRIAQALLTNIYGVTDLPEQESLTMFQRPNGGIAPLAYASEDAELSAKIATTAPDLFDRARLSGYLWSIADNPKVSREESARALAGLAALGQPVLLRLNMLAQAPKLSWREMLAVARGLEAAGDREQARVWLNRLLEGASVRDGIMHLAVAPDERSILEATSEAAALASVVADPRAEQLDAYVRTNWNKAVMDDLDRAYYLAHILPTLQAGDVVIRYTTGGSEKSVDLSDGSTQTLFLTREEARSFRVTSATAPAAATFIRRTPGLPATTPEITLKREYAIGAQSIAELSEGMTVDVTLTPTWSASAQDGCYVIRDHIPSGLAPLVSLVYNTYEIANDRWYPASLGPQEISFVACKTRRPSTIRYRARVVSRGTYVAEPAIMQSMDVPAVTALSAEQRITIK